MVLMDPVGKNNGSAIRRHSSGTLTPKLKDCRQISLSILSKSKQTS